MRPVWLVIQLKNQDGSIAPLYPFSPEETRIRAYALLIDPETGLVKWREDDAETGRYVHRSAVMSRVTSLVIGAVD